MSVIMITGASRGIGRAAALSFAVPGTTLVVVCRTNEAELKKLAAEVSQLGAVCLPYLADLSDSAQVNSLFASLQERNLTVDVLINNAGICYTGLLQDMTDEDWHSVLDVNLSSVFYCCRAVIPMMLAKGSGRIINSTSIWGTHGASCEVAYSASKGGVNAFTKALAKELAPSNIQVNAVSFGFIDTDMNAALSEEDRKTFTENYIPAGRIAGAEEAGQFLFRIASSESYLTGQIIGFDGGY